MILFKADYEDILGNLFTSPDLTNVRKKLIFLIYFKVCLFKVNFILE
jgi:hypothetical protein